MSTFTEHREDTVSTESPPAGATGPPISGNDQRRVRSVIALVTVLAAAVVALGSWVIIDQTATSDTAVTAEVQQLLDDYHAAWNDWDGDAFLELVTDDAFIVTGGQSTTAERQAFFIDRLGATNWHVEAIGEPIMSGDGPWYVAQVNLLTSDTSPDEGYEGMSIVTVVDIDGTLQISRHVYYGQS